MLLYQSMARRNFKTGEKLYYPQIATCNAVDFDDVCNEIAAKCTLTRPDVEAVLIDLEEHIVMHLKEGQTVRLGRLGSFRLSIKNQSTSESLNEAIAVGAKSIKNVKVHFTPGVYIRRALSMNNLTFGNAESAKKG